MSPSSDWTDRGRELGASLDACHAVVVVGADPVATSEVALGIARAQAANRRVAVVDLIGDAPPLQALVTSEDPHGIVDSFVFGVSLNKIANAVLDTPNLFVMPSGSTPIDYDELFSSPRWGRLSGGFREVGALMILAAPFDAPHLKDLVSFTDGLVIVGESAPADVAVAQALAWLRPRRPGATPTPPRAIAVPMLAPAKPIERGKLIAGIAGIGLALLIATSMFWFARRPFAGQKPARAVSESTATAPVAAPILHDTIRTFTARADSATRDSGAAAIDSFAVLPITNPGDSSKAAAWSVRLEQTNTPSAAILDLRGRFETVPAGTYGFDDLRTRFILLVAGAYTARAGAESLLAQLRQHRMLAPDNGSVISLPFAFLVQQDVPPAELPQRLKRFAASGKPVYALRQPNGAWHMYYGAYASPQHAALALAAVRDAGLTPTLVYRIGRVD